MSINYDKYIASATTHYIANSGGDEKGGISGGAAGDQTGKEWQLKPWYSRPWTHVFRHPDPFVRRCIAELAIEGALNDKIGYDQYQRGTFWTQLKKAGYRPANITVKCEEDCSAGCAAIVKATGYLLGIRKLQEVPSTATSRNTKAALTKAGFTVHTAKGYLSKHNLLLPGDILLYENRHVATNVTRGKSAGGDVATHQALEAVLSSDGRKPLEPGVVDPDPEVTVKPTNRPYITIHNCVSCNIRLGPGTEYPEVGTATPGCIYDTPIPEWTPVMIGQTVRWISSKYATVVAPDEEE